jgi:hypothetical protein
MIRRVQDGRLYKSLRDDIKYLLRRLWTQFTVVTTNIESNLF